MTPQQEKEEVQMVEAAEVSTTDVVASHDAVNKSVIQVLKENPKPMLMTMLMSLGPMAFGFDIIIVGVVTAIPAFL
jgi:hypothetical protein